MLQTDKDFDAADKKPTDRQLRKVGFRIHSRPDGQEAVWEMGGSTYTESEAWAWLNREALKA